MDSYQLFPSKKAKIVCITLKEEDGTQQVADTQPPTNAHHQEAGKFWLKARHNDRLRRSVSEFVISVFLQILMTLVHGLCLLL